MVEGEPAGLLINSRKKLIPQQGPLCQSGSSSSLLSNRERDPEGRGELHRTEGFWDFTCSSGPSARPQHCGPAPRAMLCSCQVGTGCGAVGLWGCRAMGLWASHSFLHSDWPLTSEVCGLSMQQLFHCPDLFQQHQLLFHLSSWPAICYLN